MPEPVPVPATPDASEDEGSDASGSHVLEPADLSPQQAEAAGGEHAAEMVSSRPDETFANEAVAEVPWESSAPGARGSSKRRDHAGARGVVRLGGVAPTG